MNIKGTAVRSILEFVKAEHPDGVQLWLQNMSEQARKIMSEPIFVTNWYPLKEACIEPTETLARLFYNNDILNTAYNSGIYSAKSALSGVYKIFIKVASPNFIINRATIIFSSYYEPSEIVVIENLSKSALVHVTKFPEMNVVVEQRIKGWMQQAITMAGAKNLSIEITKSLTQGDAVSEFKIKWQ